VGTAVRPTSDLRRRRPRSKLIYFQTGNFQVNAEFAFGQDKMAIGDWRLPIDD